MPFLFVDRITESSKHAIKGELTLPENSPYVSSKGYVYPGIVSEAIGQLASWQAIFDNDFSARPVFLFAEGLEILNKVEAHTRLDLQAEIHHQDQESINFSGTASSEGRMVMRIKSCTGYFMPLAQLEDPQITRQRYNALITEEGGIYARESTLPRLENVFNNLLYQDLGARTLEAHGKMDVNHHFYQDHFPRFPVTPIVIINQLIAQVCDKLILTDSHHVSEVTLSELCHIKIREFLKPGDEFTITAKINEHLEFNNHHQEFMIHVQMKSGTKNLLRGQFRFTTQCHRYGEITA